MSRIQITYEFPTIPDVSRTMFETIYNEGKLEFCYGFNNDFALAQFYEELSGWISMGEAANKGENMAIVSARWITKKNGDFIEVVAKYDGVKESTGH